MRLSTILPALAVICSVQVSAIPTQRSGIQSEIKPSMVEPKLDSTAHQNSEQNQRSELKSKDHNSSEENSPKDSADRIRKIVEAALASRRPSKPYRRVYFTSNNKKNESREINETPNRKSDGISHTNTSMSLNNVAKESKNPVRPSAHMIKNINAPSNIRRPHIVNNGNINNNSKKASIRRSESARLIENKPIPQTNTKTKPQKNMNTMSSSHTFSRLSDSEDHVPVIASKSMPTSQQKSKIISIKNRNNDIKSKNSDLSSTADTKSMINAQITPSTEGRYIFNNNKYSNFKSISPWEKRTEIDRKSQHDAIRELIGRHVLSSGSTESHESHKTLSKTQYGSIVGSSFGSPSEKNVDKETSSSEENHQHRKSTAPISNRRRAMQETIKSFRNIMPKKDMVQLEKNTNLPKEIEKNNVNVLLPTTTEVDIPTMMPADNMEPIGVTEISDVGTDITENIRIVDKMHTPTEMSVVIKEPLHVTETSNVNNVNESVVEADIPEHFRIMEQIHPKLTNGNESSKKSYQTTSDQNKRNQEQVIHTTEETTDIFKVNSNNDSDENESFIKADSLESMKTTDQIQVTSPESVKPSDQRQVIPLESTKTLDQITVTSLESMKSSGQIVLKSLESMKTSDQSQIPFKENDNNTFDAHKIPLEENEESIEQGIAINERELKTSIINAALDDYSDIIGSLVDYVELGTLDYDEPDDKPEEKRDLSQMIVDLFFKVTGFNGR